MSFYNLLSLISSPNLCLRNQFWWSLGPSWRMTISSLFEVKCVARRWLGCPSYLMVMECDLRLICCTGGAKFHLHEDLICFDWGTGTSCWVAWYLLPWIVSSSVWWETCQCYPQNQVCLLNSRSDPLWHSPSLICILTEIVGHLAPV